MVKKSKNKLVSIIIRGKNESRWLKILLKELKKQTYKKYEIIFCNNNSDDNTKDILKSFNIKKIININNYLPGNSLNKAISKCNGEFISILSSHCIPVDNNWLSDYLNFFKTHSNVVAAYGKQVPLPGTTYQNLIDLDIIFKDQKIIFGKDPYFNNANSFYKSSILKKNKFNDKITNIEDSIWAKKISKKGYRVAYTGKSKVFHIHGIHQHETRSKRSENTYKIVEKKYQKIWSKCAFLNLKYHNFCLLVNARRLKDKKILKTRVNWFIKNSLFKKYNFKKILVISNFKLRNSKKVIYLKSKETLKTDLKNIYKRFFKLWKNINYNVYFNLDAKVDLKRLEKLMEKTIYNNYECLSLAEDIKKNFIIKFKDSGVIKSTSLDKSDNKATIYLLKWSQGIVFDPDYLRRGILFSNNSSNIDF
jgi:glycosyltransferase involved in cell wall biosynthesis